MARKIKTNHFVIYALIHPFTRETRYIGKTVNAKKRLRGHIDDALTRQTDYPVNRWIRQLDRQGLRPEMIIIESHFTMGDMNRAEVWNIATLKEAGVRLLNISEGGDGGWTSAMALKGIATMGKAGIAARTAKMIETIGYDVLCAKAIAICENMTKEELSQRSKKVNETRRLKTGVPMPVGIGYHRKKQKWIARTLVSEYGCRGQVGAYDSLREAIDGLEAYHIMNPLTTLP